MLISCLVEWKRYLKTQHPHRKLGRGGARRRRRFLENLRAIERLEDRTLLSSFVVNSTADTVDASPGDGVAEDASENTTLRAAIMEANALAGPDEIQLPAGTYTLTLAGAEEDAGATGDLDVIDDLTIVGAGPGVTIIDGNQLDRVFHTISADFHISGITITGGQAPDGSSTDEQGNMNDGGGILSEYADLELANVVIRGNRTGTGRYGGYGGGIYSVSGSLNVMNSTIEQNVTGNATGTGIGGSGGGIRGLNTTITITDAVIAENQTGDGRSTSDVSAGDGGGISAERGSLTIVNSVIRDNVTGVNQRRSGGGIYSTGDLILENSVVSGNEGLRGGGLYAGTTARIIDSTISGNTAFGGGGGGVYNNGSNTIELISGTTISGNTSIESPFFADPGGGGLENRGDIETIVNSTISGNTTSGNGGGILNNGNISRIVNTTIANNSAEDGGGLFHMLFANLTPVIGELQNTIIADNTAYRYNARDFRRLGDLVTVHNNLIEDPYGHGVLDGVNGNLVGVDPLLAPLANNGGPTWTHAITGLSPAFSGGSNLIAPNTDQRGYPRPAEAIADIGAFEWQEFEDGFTVDEDTTLNSPYSVLLTDQLGPSATASLVSDVTHGTLSLNSDGNFTYTPDANFHGADSFTYYATDGSTERVGTAMIIVLPVNDVPVANDDTYIMDEDGRLVISTLTAGSDLVLRYDFDEAASGSDLATDSGAVSPPAGGTFDGVATRTGQTPGSATTGALDLTGGTNSNNYVTAGDADKVDALKSMTVTAWINLQADPEHGDRILSDYLPHQSGYNGRRAWEWRIEDPATGTAARANNFRLAFSMYETSESGVLKSGSFSAQNFNADAQWLFIAMTVNSSGAGIMYSAYESSEEVDLRLQGGNPFPVSGGDNPLDLRIGGLSSEPDTDHTPPAWIDDVRIYDRALTAVELDDVRREALGNLSTGGVLGNDTDIDGDQLQAILVSGPSNGTLTLDGDGGFIYTPNPDFYGTDSFTYRATDGTADSNVATVTIHVNSVVDLPVITSPTAPVRVNADTFTIEGTAEPDTLVRVFHDVNNNGMIDTGESVVGSQQLSGGATAFSIPVSLTADARHNFLVTADDGQGNISLPVDIPLITEDSTAPSVDIVNIIPDPRGTPVESVTVNFSEAVSGVDAADFVLTRDGVSVPLDGLVVTAINDSQYTFDLTDFTAAAGAYELTLSASGSGIQDAAGNSLAADAVEQWTVDPTLTLTVEVSVDTIPEPGGANAATGTVRRNANGNLSDPLTVYLSVSDGSEAEVPPFVVIPANETSVTFPIGAVDDASVDFDQTVTITATADLPGLLTEDATYGTGGDSSPPMSIVDSVFQPDGKLVVVGYARVGTGSEANNDFFVARFDSEGVLDPTFGAAGTGFIMKDIDSLSDNAYAVELQSDGKILVGGESFDSDAQHHRAGVLLRYNTDGTLDTTFGTDGVVYNDRTSVGDPFHDFLVLPDDSILAVGAYSSSSGAMYHYDVDGIPLPFSSGLEFFHLGLGTGQATSITRQADGKIVVGGWARYAGGNGREFGVVRLTEDFEFDTTFGEDGVVSTHWTPNDERVETVAVQPDGKIVAVGRVVAGGGEPNRHAVVRYNVDGSLDQSFGDGGIVVTEHEGSAIAFDVYILPDGSILVNGTGGGTGSSGLLTRYSAGGTLIESSTRLLDEPVGTSIVVDSEWNIFATSYAGNSGSVQKFSPVQFMTASAEITVLDDDLPVAFDDAYTITAGTTLEAVSVTGEPEIDQQSAAEGHNFNFGLDDVNWQQQVVAGKEGLLESVEIFLRSSSNSGTEIDFYLNRGPAWQSDTPEFRKTFSITLGDIVAGSKTLDVSSAGIVLTAGDVFTFGVIGRNQASGYLLGGNTNNGDPYPDGQLFFNGAPYGGSNSHDLKFTTRIARQPGVLVNDYDPPGDPLTASLVTTTTHGTLVFNTDGTFTYTPEDGFSGIDTFTYQATDNGVDSNTATVTIAVSTTGGPMLIDPIQTIEDATPTFSWSPILNADRYELWVYDETHNIHQVIHETHLTETSFTPTADLPASRYKFWVRAFNDDVPGPWSAAAEFTVGTAPAVPVPMAPGGVVDDLTPTFTWSDVGADHYELWVYHHDSDTHQVIHETELSGTEFTPEDPLEEGTYTFWVRAFSSTGATNGWSAGAEFSVGTVPDVPTLNGPETVTSNTTPVFTWTDVGAARYELWVYSITTNTHQVIHETELTGTSHEPTTALPLGEYRVWVQAYSSTGLSNGWSAGYDFTIANVPAAPTVLGPVGNMLNLRPTFEWQPVPGADHYELWVRNNTRDMQEYLRVNDISGTTYTPPSDFPSGHYRFWVRAFSAEGTAGPWSATTQFSVGIPEMPVNLGPSGTTTDTTPTFTWDPAAGAVLYDLWVYDATLDKHEVIRQTALETNAYTPTTAMAAHTYYFWVRGINADGLAGPWSFQSEFTIETASLDAFALEPAALPDDERDDYDEAEEAEETQQDDALVLAARSDDEAEATDAVMARWNEVEWWESVRFVMNETRDRTARHTR